MFIVFEGIDAVGKSSVINFLKEELIEKRKIPVIFTREPGGGNSQLQEQIRELLISNKTPLSKQVQALLFAISRHLHVKEIIEPALKHGIVVVSDRYFFSSWAYQSVKEGEGFKLEEVKQLNDLITQNLYPDLVFWLALPVQELQKRKMLEKNDRFEGEGEEFLKNVNRNYNYFFEENPDEFLPKTTKAVVINAAQSKERVFEKVKEKILETLERGGYDCSLKN